MVWKQILSESGIEAMKPTPGPPDHGVLISPVTRTHGNKDFVGWDILTDSLCLGSPHTQMNTRFLQSGQIFPQFRF